MGVAHGRQTLSFPEDLKEVLGLSLSKSEKLDANRKMPEGRCKWVDKSGRPLSDDRMLNLGAKKLTGGWHSSSVWLLPGGIVEKRYGTTDERARRLEIEVTILTRLQSCDFVPKIVNIDKDNGILRMTYCGKKAIESVAMRRQLHKLMKILEEKYGVYRKNNIGKRTYKLGCNRNVTQDENGKLFIIDFGSDHWKIKESPGPVQIIKLPKHSIHPDY